jgi:hypothetical protein
VAQAREDLFCKSCQKKTKRTGDVAQWYSTHLACIRPWIQSPAMRKKKKRKESKIEFLCCLSPTSGYTLENTENRFLKRYFHNHVYGSTIHNSQEVEATQVSIDINE